MYIYIYSVASSAIVNLLFLAFVQKTYKAIRELRKQNFLLLQQHLGKCSCNRRSLTEVFLITVLKIW